MVHSARQHGHSTSTTTKKYSYMSMSSRKFKTFKEFFTLLVSASDQEFDILNICNYSNGFN